MSKRITHLTLLCLAFLILGGLGGCSSTPTLIPEPTTTKGQSPVVASNTSPSLSGATATRVPNTPRISPTVKETPFAEIIPTANAAQLDAELTKKQLERTVIRTFVDAQGRSIKLLYGRGSGYNGDYGWAHILGKHIEGVWYDGGTVTTYGKAVGVSSPSKVLDLIGKSFQDKKPDDAGNGRRSYVYAVPGTNKDVFTVVGNDGTIITAYPVNHGSKDEDS